MRVTASDAGGVAGRPRGRRWAIGLALIAILVFAGVLRVYDLRDNPAGLFCDEAALGYNAYSILRCGRDEHGVRFPLYFWSFGGYKNPLYIYTAIVPIALLGLDEFSLRLTSVFFGLVTIWGVYLLSSEILNRKAGLLAALLLGVSPWHIHFSRIAFELVSLPACFVFGFYFLVRGVKRKKNWCWYLGAFFFGLCFYAYAPSKLQVPLFLLGAALLYMREVWRRKIGFLLALAVFVLTIAPSLRFSYVNKARSQRYFTRTSIFRREKNPQKLAQIFWKNYKIFYGREFLFEKMRDPIIRHGVRNFGVYPRFFLPLTLLGLVCIIVRRDRNMFLVLVWFALYPVAASLMTEIPSASRSFFGVPILPIVCSYGLCSIFLLAERLRWRWLAYGIEIAICAVLCVYIVKDLRPYLREYFDRYPSYSAGGMGGFQHGYRDVIRYMESQRDKYDLLMLTTTSTNQPTIFALFYSGIEPADYLRTRYPGYLILSPKEYRRYSMDKRVLYSLRDKDLNLFSDLEKKMVTRCPSRGAQFTVAEVRGRKEYINTWMTAGLFDNRGRRGNREEFIDIERFNLDETYDGRYGKVKWVRMKNQFVETNFNSFYAWQPADKRRGNPERVCAYVVTYVGCPTERDAVLEVAGSPDHYTVWLNKEEIARNAFPRTESTVHKYNVRLREGENELLIKSCESIGGWYPLARLISPEGEDFSDTSYYHRSSQPVAKRVASPKKRSAKKKKRVKAGTFQLVEGFANIVSSAHTQNTYSDTRGGAEGWWEYYRTGGEKVTWETAVCPQKRDTVFVFYGQTGEDRGKAELLFNGKPALVFETGLKEDGEWAGDGFVLVKHSMGTAAGNCGLYFLRVPKGRIVAGRPARITVSHIDGDRVSWFMIKNYGDNIIREGVHDAVLPQALHRDN